MIDVRVELFRLETGSHLDFFMKVRPENIDLVSEYIEDRYPDWYLQKILVAR